MYFFFEIFTNIKIRFLLVFDVEKVLETSKAPVSPSLIRRHALLNLIRECLTRGLIAGPSI